MSAAEELATQAAFRKAVRAETLKQIATLLGVSTEHLYEETERERNERAQRDADDNQL